MMAGPYSDEVVYSNLTMGRELCQITNQYLVIVCIANLLDLLFSKVHSEVEQ